MPVLSTAGQYAAIGMGTLGYVISLPIGIFFGSCCVAIRIANNTLNKEQIATMKKTAQVFVGATLIATGSACLLASQDVFHFPPETISLSKKIQVGAIFPLVQSTIGSIAGGVSFGLFGRCARRAV